jgi:asparagine synthase (glutamine-hydrolysing)
LFAYLASHDSGRIREGETALVNFATQFDVPKSQLQQVALGSFQLHYFDTGQELSVYQDGRHVLLLAGSILSDEAIRPARPLPGANQAELMFHRYGNTPDNLRQVDGHWSFVLYDSVENRLSLVGDRFQRYSIVYSLADATYLSSHSQLLLKMTANNDLDPEALCQSVHFRWLTGQRRLFQGIRQVLPGSITHIETGPRVDHRPYYRLDFQHSDDGDLGYWIEQTEQAIDTVLARIATRHSEIGIPLSGGVDSSLLLAKAKRHFDRCIAVTIRFADGDNPELDNARYFARESGVQHVIVDLADDYIRSFFPKLLRIHEQPPRNYSDIALARALEALSGEVGAFLYGEAADLLFGSSPVRARVSALTKTQAARRLPTLLQRLIAGLIPAPSRRLRWVKDLLRYGGDDFIRSASSIEYATAPSSVFNCSDKPVSDRVLNEVLENCEMPVEDRVKSQLLYTAIVNHIENTGRLASYYGIEMFVPFVLGDLLDIGGRLPLHLRCIDGNYKPILRELACRHYDRDRIYSQKHGFPTPTVAWLEGPLRERVDMSRNGLGAATQYYSGSNLAELSIEEDFELVWFAICLDELVAGAAAQ